MENRQACGISNWLVPDIWLFKKTDTAESKIEAFPGLDNIEERFPVRGGVPITYRYADNVKPLLGLIQKCKMLLVLTRATTTYVQWHASRVVHMKALDDEPVSERRSVRSPPHLNGPLLENATSTSSCFSKTSN